MLLYLFDWVWYNYSLYRVSQNNSDLSQVECFGWSYSLSDTLFSVKDIRIDWICNVYKSELQINSDIGWWQKIIETIDFLTEFIETICCVIGQKAL